MRIVSLVPSLSETLVDLGLRNELVGCTSFCVEPKDLYRTTAIVGGTKDFSLDKIRDLRPTHVIANQEENPRELIQLLQRDYPLLLTFPKSPCDVPSMLRQMGHFLGCDFEASAIDMEAALRNIRQTAQPSRFAYFIWREPYMLAGRDTYISHLLEAFGFINAYEGEERYPALGVEEIKGLGPDICLFSSEPYPFRKRDASRLREAWPACPQIGKIDGRLMSWYGTTTKKALQMVEQSVVGNGFSWL